MVGPTEEAAREEKVSCTMRRKDEKTTIVVRGSEAAIE